MSNSKPSHKARPTETEEQRQKRLACHREWMRRHRTAHPEIAREISRRYYEKHPEKIKQRYLERYARDREKIIASVCEYSKRNRVKINARNKTRYRSDVEKARAQSRERYVRRQDLPEKKRSEIRKKHAAYMRTKRNTDPAFLVADRLRRRINEAIHSAKCGKAGGLVEVSGCTVHDLVRHIEKQFADGMSWDNRRQWHIDHIVPCSAFDLTDPAEQRIAFHYSNLRPIWSSENQRKHAKIPGGQRKFFWSHDDIKKARKRLT